MKAINSLTLAKHEGEYASWPVKTEIFDNGVATGKKISGFVIEAQYAHANGFLVVTSWDCPFEEAQTFTWLSPSFDVLKEKTIGIAYEAIWMESHKPLDDDSAVFHLSGDLDVVVTISSPRSFKLKKFHRVSN